MTITSAGGNAQVLKDAAYNAAYATSITTTTGTPGDAGAAATAGNAAVGALGATAVDNTTADVADISISASQMASILQDKDFTLSDGSDTYKVTSNAVTINGNAANIDGSGTITDQTSKVVNYFAHTNGSVTNDTGSTIYATEDGSLTTDAATKAETTADPESSGRSHQLHRQIPLLPRCGAEPSGFRGHQPEQHHYQPVRSAVPYSGRRLCDRSVQHVESADHSAGR